MIFNHIFRKLIVRVIYLALFFAMGVSFHKYVHISDYLRISDILAFTNSPVSSIQAHARGWDSFKILHYPQDDGSVHLRRYVETGLLPIIIDGKRLSDSYPVAKVGGAITVVDTTVVILDRLGSLYRYELTTGAFEPLQIP